MVGLGSNSTALPGAFKQLSKEYAGLTIQIADDGGSAYAKWLIMEIPDGQIISK